MIKKWYINYLFILIALTYVSSSAFSQAQNGPGKHTTSLPSKLLAAPKYSSVATLSLGPVWEETGNTQTFYLTPNIEKTYSANHASHALVDGEIFLGIQKPIREKLDCQIGLAVAITSNASLSGSIWDDAQAKFNNYTYNYQVWHTHVAIKGKLLADRSYVVTPWVSGSVGVGFNQAHHFSNTPTISEAVVMSNFASNTTTAFTYTLGVGIERHLNQHWQAGAGYEFADWGKSQLNRASGQTLNRGLSLSHLYTNGLLFSLTYSAEG
jgi:opacity protein-like surface antigen